MKFSKEVFTIKKIPKVVWSSEDSFNLKPKPLTFVFLVFGLFLFGLGESLLITSGAGVGPYTVLAQGISNLTDWSIGLSTFVISIFVLVLWIPLKQKPGMGTILNAFIIALTIEFSVYYLPYPESYPMQVCNWGPHYRAWERFLFNLKFRCWTKGWANDWLTKNKQHANIFNPDHD